MSPFYADFVSCFFVPFANSFYTTAVMYIFAIAVFIELYTFYTTVVMYHIFHCSIYRVIYTYLTYVAVPYLPLQYL
jgi:hypothetical protein